MAHAIRRLASENYGFSKCKVTSERSEGYTSDPDVRKNRKRTVEDKRRGRILYWRSAFGLRIPYLHEGGANYFLSNDFTDADTFQSRFKLANVKVENVCFLEKKQVGLEIQDAA